jgi:hypothetical protein
MAADRSILGGLAMLALDDPDRRAAESHADACPPCRRALDEAARTLSLLDAAVELAPVDALSVHARAHSAVLAEWDAAPSRVTSAEAVPSSPSLAIPIAAAVAAAWAVFMGSIRARAGEGAMWSVAAAALASVGALYVVGRDRLALGLAVAGSVAFAFTVGHAGPLDTGVGIACALHELGTAMAPLFVAGALAATGRASISPTGFAAAAAAGALAGQGVLHLACPDAQALPHLMVFHVGAVLVAAAALVFSLTHDSMRSGRITAWLHPEAHASGVALQAEQAKIAIGSGGLTGLGLGDGMQKHGFLPEIQSDFIFANIGEELGLVATLFVLLAFLTITICGLFIALRARDQFGCLLAVGITSLISYQAIINIGVVTSLLPNKGLALPFISAGGSSLLAMLMGVGILLSVARQAVPVKITPSDFVANDNPFAAKAA